MDPPCSKYSGNQSDIAWSPLIAYFFSFLRFTSNFCLTQGSYWGKIPPAQRFLLCDPFLTAVS